MSHWKTGVKILCSKSWEGQNSMKAKIWGSKFYFFLVEPLVKILCSLKRGVKILYFFPVPWKRGVKTAEPTNQLHWRGAPPGSDTLRIRPVRWRKWNRIRIDLARLADPIDLSQHGTTVHHVICHETSAVSNDMPLNPYMSNKTLRCRAEPSHDLEKTRQGSVNPRETLVGHGVEMNIKHRRQNRH